MHYAAASSTDISFIYITLIPSLMLKTKTRTFFTITRKRPKQFLMPRPVLEKQCVQAAMIRSRYCQQYSLERFKVLNLSILALQFVHHLRLICKSYFSERHG